MNSVKMQVRDINLAFLFIFMNTKEMLCIKIFLMYNMTKTFCHPLLVQFIKNRISYFALCIDDV